MQIKVYDTVSKHERTVTKKAFDIINRARRKQPRYQVLEYLDDEGNTIDSPEITQPTKIVEKKSEPAEVVDDEPKQIDEHVETVSDPIPTYGNYYFDEPIENTEKPAPKKRGRKPKNKVDNA